MTTESNKTKSNQMCLYPLHTVRSAQLFLTIKLNSFDTMKSLNSPLTIHRHSEREYLIDFRYFPLKSHLVSFEYGVYIAEYACVHPFMSEQRANPSQNCCAINVT